VKGSRYSNAIPTAFQSCKLALTERSTKLSPLLEEGNEGDLQNIARSEFQVATTMMFPNLHLKSGVFGMLFPTNMTDVPPDLDPIAGTAD